MTNFAIALVLCVCLGASHWIVERANAKGIRFASIPICTAFVIISMIGGCALFCHQIISIW